MTSLIQRLRDRAAQEPGSVTEMAEQLCKEAADQLELLELAMKVPKGQEIKEWPKFDEDMGGWLRWYGNKLNWSAEHVREVKPLLVQVAERLEALQTKIERYEREIGRQRLEYPDLTKAEDRIRELEGGLWRLRQHLIIRNSEAMSARSEVLHKVEKILDGKDLE